MQASQPFEILLAWIDTRIRVASGQTALAALMEAGLPFEPGCMTGGCGACATHFNKGDMIHKSGGRSAGHMKTLAVEPRAEQA